MPREIRREEVRKLVASGAQLVEVLPSPEYEEDHLPGAIHVPRGARRAAVGSGPNMTVGLAQQIGRRAQAHRNG